MALVEPLNVMFLQDASLASKPPYHLQLSSSAAPCEPGARFLRRAYLFVPVLQPLPTTKSPAPENETEYPLLAGEKLTEPLVT